MLFSGLYMLLSYGEEKTTYMKHGGCGEADKVCVRVNSQITLIFKISKM